MLFHDFYYYSNFINILHEKKCEYSNEIKLLSQNGILTNEK